MPALNAAFFDAVRPLFGGTMKQSQVDGLNLIAKAWDKYGDGDSAKLAYILATAFHETAQTMQPIKEYGRGKGKEYGKVDETGKAPYGRGFVQLTWRANYVKADKELKLGGKLAGNYDLALDPAISVRVLIAGMMEGWFTTRKLPEYVHEGVRDFEGARRVVNGTDKASLIADHARTFLRALEAVPARNGTDTPADPETPPTGLAGLLAALITFIVNLFRKDR